jgi:hypothetical protein
MRPEEKNKAACAGEIVAGEAAPTLGQPSDQPAGNHDLTHGMGIAYDCKSAWDSMNGSDCLRQCGRCQLWVVKADGMSDDGFLKLLDDNANLFNSAIEKASSNSARSVAAKFVDFKNLKLYRRHDGTFTVGDCYAVRYAKSATVAVYFMLPFVLLGLTYAMAPGYLVPWFNHPIARLVIIALVPWHGLGTWLFSRTSNFALQMVIAVFFMGPLILVPQLGPTTDTIQQALGPLERGK